MDVLDFTVIVLLINAARSIPIWLKEYNVKDVDNSAYYGQSVYKFIRDHVGYRLVLRKSSIPSKVEQGEIFKIEFARHAREFL